MIIPILIGVVAIFIWSKLSPKMPTEKTELLETPLPESRDIMDVFKENAPKVAAIVGGALGIGKVATVVGGVGGAVGGAAAIGGTAIAVSALPAATVIPAGLSAMAPTTLASATYGVTPTVVGTGTGSSSIGAGVGGSSGVGAALGGAAMVAAPLVIMPLIAKALDSIFFKDWKDVYDDPELLARQEAITARSKELVATGSMSWNPKTGFVDDPDDPSAFPGGK